MAKEGWITKDAMGVGALAADEDGRKVMEDGFVTLEKLDPSVVKGILEESIKAAVEAVTVAMKPAPEPEPAAEPVAEPVGGS